MVAKCLQNYSIPFALMLSFKYSHEIFALLKLEDYEKLKVVLRGIWLVLHGNIGMLNTQA